MDELIVYASDLTAADRLLLKNLSADIARHSGRPGRPSSLADGCDGKAGIVQPDQEVHADKSHIRLREQVKENGAAPGNGDLDQSDGDAGDVALMKSWNDPGQDVFEPTVFVSVDLSALKVSPWIDRYLLQPYISWARKVARRPTDVVMVTHLILYFLTSVPSAVYLFWNFRYLHGILHFAMQAYYVGTYTLMMHQHIHMRGVLSARYSPIDQLFPYITDLLMGHTWNSYFYHHCKHHHVESNGPGDLSSTLRYQRDSLRDFLCYLGRFYFFIWLELPMYFLSKRRFTLALKAAFWELSSYATYYALARAIDWRPTLFAFVLPLLAMRVGLMVGNWGQHAFVDPDEPDSDFRSSITLIDVASNRYCFNDGYHTSHHLNPLRHWRDHPAAFLQQKGAYAREGALVFHNIDYIEVTVRLMMKDYAHLARCMVPLGRQSELSLQERAELLRRCTRRFSEEDIRKKFAVCK